MSGVGLPEWRAPHLADATPARRRSGRGGLHVALTARIAAEAVVKRRRKGHAIIVENLKRAGEASADAGIGYIECSGRKRRIWPRAHRQSMKSSP